MRKKLSVVAIVLAIFLLLFVFFAAGSNGGRCSVGFVGYTSNTLGGRAAVFALTNLYVRPVGFVTFQRQSSNSKYATLVVNHTNAEVGAQTVEMFAIPEPTNPVPWRVDAYYKQKPRLSDQLRARLGGWLAPYQKQMPILKWVLPQPPSWERALGPELSSPPQ